MSDGGGGGKTQTVVQNTNADPWSGQQEYLKTGFGRAQSDILNRPLEYFPGETQAPFSSQTQQSMDMTENRALNGNPLTGQAQGEASKVLGGDYLSGGNPAYQGMVDRSVQPLTEQYETTVRPGIMSAFTQAGRSGSNIARAQAENTAGNDYMRQVGNVGSGLSYQNYNDERGRQQQMAAAAPALAQQDYFDLGALQGVGSQYDQQAQGNIQDDLNRYNFAQGAPTQQVADYMGLIKGGYGGPSSSSSQVPVQSGNSFLSALGGGAMGASALASLFGGANAPFSKPWV